MKKQQPGGILKTLIVINVAVFLLILHWDNKKSLMDNTVVTRIDFSDSRTYQGVNFFGHCFRDLEQKNIEYCPTDNRP